MDKLFIHDMRQESIVMSWKFIILGWGYTFIYDARFAFILFSQHMY